MSIQPVMSYKWGNRSRERMQGLHNDLINVLDAVIEVTPIDLTILEGVRSMERQIELLRIGATTTLRSRHLTGHAVDLAPYVDGEVRWDWPLYRQIAPVIKAVADSKGVSIKWGGDWKKFPDGPHWQLSWDDYQMTYNPPMRSLFEENFRFKAK